MINIIFRPQCYTPRLAGLSLTLVVTVLALGLAENTTVQSWGIGALTLAIICGILLGNSLYPAIQERCQSGVLFAKQSLLKIGIILYGFRLTFSQITDIGLSGLLIDVTMLCSTFMLACWVGPRLFGLDKQTSWLIGAGSSICGAAAVLATAPVVKAQADKVTTAVATVVIFGTLAIFIYPSLYPWVAHWVTPGTFGIYIGSTVHEVAQVVAAGQAIDPSVERSAVIAKILRVMMLAPFLFFLAWRVNALSSRCGEKPGKITVPWFAILFIAVAALNSCQLLPPIMVQGLIHIDTLFLAMAMTALGITTRISTLFKAGLRPFLMALILFIWLVVGGGAVNWVWHILLA